MRLIQSLTLLALSASLAFGQGLATKKTLTLDVAKQMAAAAEAVRAAGARVVGCAAVAAAGAQVPTGPADAAAARLA